jgi:hypothetical protein
MNIYALGTASNSVEIESDDPQIHTAVSGAVTFVDEAKRFALMSIYEQRMNRSIHKNLATLRELQAERKANYQHDIEEEIIFARASDINDLPYEAPTTPSENGFVFSTHEICAAAHRLTSFVLARMTVNHAKFKVQFAGASSCQPSNVAEWPKPDAA